MHIEADENEMKIQKLFQFNAFWILLCILILIKIFSLCFYVLLLEKDLEGVNLAILSKYINELKFWMGASFSTEKMVRF